MSAPERVTILGIDAPLTICVARDPRGRVIAITSLEISGLTGDFDLEEVSAELSTAMICAAALNAGLEAGLSPLEFYESGTDPDDSDDSGDGDFVSRVMRAVCDAVDLANANRPAVMQ